MFTKEIFMLLIMFKLFLLFFTGSYVHDMDIVDALRKAHAVVLENQLKEKQKK